jgi:predicted metal-dependent peptidase
MPSPPQYEPQKTPLEDYCSSDSGRENTENWQYDEMKQTQINEKIEDIAQRNQWGNITNSLREQVLATLKPKMDYRAVLSAFRASILSQKRVLTRMKESRRYGFLYMGSRRDFATKLLVAVDVSGSMSSGMIAKGFSVINQFFRYGIERIDVMQFDCEIQGKIQKFQKAQAKINLIGRGGTNFQVVFDYIEKHRDYDGVIIFTDGDAYQPKRGNNRKTRIIWLLDTFDNYQKSLPYLSATGKCTYIRE